MRSQIMLTGDINLMGVEDPAAPFRRVTDTLSQADALFANLECCLYEPPQPRTMMPHEVSGYEGFYAPPATGKALVLGGFHLEGVDAVGDDAEPAVRRPGRRHPPSR